MATIESLHKKAWFRLLKVLYCSLYLPYLFGVIVGLGAYGQDFHPEKLPIDHREALADPDFLELKTEEKRRILNLIDSYFASKSRDEQDAILTIIERKIYEHDKNKAGALARTDGSLSRFVFEDTTSRGGWEVVAQEPAPARGRWVDVTEAPPPPPRRLSIDEAVYSPYSDSPFPRGTFKYAGYYTWNLGNATAFIVLFSIGYFVVMETLKRVFYYVTIGRLFPPKA